MTPAWTPEGLSAVTGEPIDRLAALADTGLLVRQADGNYDADALNRMRLIRFARDRGAGEDRLAAAVAVQGDLLGIFEGLSSAEPTPHTLVQAAAQAGLPADLMAELTGILGWDATAVATSEDVEALSLLVRAVTTGLDREPLLQLVRVYADLLDRLADAEVRIFHDYVHEQFRARGLAGRDLLTATESLGEPLLGLVEPAVLYFHRRAWERANGEDLLRHLMEETTPPSVTPGESVATVLFIDLAGFTPLTVAMGDAAAADVLHRFAAMVRDSAGRTGGRIVKQIGDAFMLTFTQPAHAISFGLDVGRLAAAESLFPAVHLGAHTGTVLFREGDYVGAAVNLAARVASAGGPGQFLITDTVHAAAGQAADAEFTALPARTLKGLSEPVRLIDVRPADHARHTDERDPVCGMRLDPSDITAVTSWRGTSYPFCSPDCARIFAETPHRYAGDDADPVPS
jgi:class 3 adenylate cyclase/YHS domain-containing protein